MNINRQSVLKAFYKFDQKKLPIVSVQGEFTASMNVKLRQELCEEWLDAFCVVDTVTWDKAIEIAAAECKRYPDIEKMWEIISRVSSAAEQVAPKQPVPEVQPPAPKTAAKKSKAPGYLNNKQKLAKMFELVKYWPDAASRLVQDSAGELREIIRQDQTCGECKGLLKCRTNGYRTIGYIDKFSGCLCTRMVECRERRKERQEQECIHLMRLKKRTRKLRRQSKPSSSARTRILS